MSSATDATVLESRDYTEGWLEDPGSIHAPWITLASGGPVNAGGHSAPSISTPCSPAAIALIVDLVGWDGANFYEGSAAPATSNTTAVLRTGDGCTDTDNNGADFAAGAPSPRNTASPLRFCSGPTNPTGVGTANPASVQPATRRS